MTATWIYMDAVAEVARLAGDIAKGYYGKDPTTRTKQDGSPVTVADEDAITLTRPGLLRVDTLLPRFFLPEHAGIRYT